jgi:hypothetical protein
MHKPLNMESLFYGFLVKQFRWKLGRKKACEVVNKSKMWARLFFVKDHIFYGIM